MPQLPVISGKDFIKFLNALGFKVIILPSNCNIALKE